ncbi:DUF2063 domain-containing protein [Grimontia hollisae]|uniref:Putative DNA-binding domain-containing protein n=1 Tax=Grimontia hollisae CIP 101886 TaxID=675812 RepID=D0I351_GRIHO|nr:DNA-binding domain-containing protein [Grimontia hollisae]AMG30687.1 DUF2063 domain-containing protein [Grimontia hollisae]EEY74093.1 hypothetical protein VHA_000182 [Grimontia hollisae CIP 101886]STO47628.1 Uncharacterized protein conserved in bacteria [Grimontia hollisae]
MSAPSLTTLQQQFRDALHYQAHSLPVSRGMAEPDALLQVYRNNFVMTLTECLETIYPVVFALVGEACFQAVARHHVLNTTMENACADRYGAGFADTIRSLPNIINAAPYLADVAGIEWHIQRVNRAPLPAAFPVDALAKLQPEDFGRIQLTVSPASAVMKSEFAVATLWQTVTNKDDDTLANLDLAQTQAVLIQKASQGISVSTLDDEQASLILACQHACFGDIDPALLSHISGAMQLGVFSNFTLTGH